jgi:hypothetical protein
MTDLTDAEERARTGRAASIARLVVRCRYLVIALVAGALAAYMVNAADRYPINDWLIFEAAARKIVHFRDLPIYSGSALHLYADLPAIQIGPPAVLPVAALQWLDPFTVDVIFVGLMLALGLAAVVAVEVLARTEDASQRVIGPAIAVGGCVVMLDWAWAIVRWHHLDDVIALSFCAIACALIARKRAWWLVGLLIGTAVAAKPWAIVLTPIFMGLDRSVRSKAVLVGIIAAGAWWGPFVLGAPGTVGALGGYHVDVDNGSVLWLIGLRGEVQSWLRPVQFLGGIAAGLCMARVGGRAWLAAPLAGLAIRVLTDPYTWAYYGMGPILFALVWDVCQPNPRRIPLFTLATAAAQGLIPRLLDFPLSGHAPTSTYFVASSKLVWGVGILVVLGLQVRRSRISTE